MRISTSKGDLSTKELAKILHQQFSDQYSYTEFGLGRKSIIARKSWLVGAQISVRENEITVEAAPPTFLSAIVSTSILTELAVFFLPLVFPGKQSIASQMKNFETEVGLFLKKKYN